ncbi:colanic acid biosynthesis glycosyl transferase [Flammeovirgaceae bacterium 311]|nr:colanic acid biosynthesis glycosyl transferase [Flammeovirgaceae bacterium 311]
MPEVSAGGNNMELSIITINLNNSAGLETTVDSVLQQSYKQLEYIVVDGGSTDGSVDILKKYNDKLTSWISEQDTGMYAAMNKGIRAASGKYLLFLNSGDYLCNEQVVEQLLSHSRGDADLIYGNLLRVFPNGMRDKVKMPETLTVETMIRGTLCHPVTLIRKDLFDTYGLYDESIRIVSDWAFFLKLIVNGKVTTQYLDTDVAVYSMDGISSKLSNAPLIEAERTRILRQYLPPAYAPLIEEVQKNHSGAPQYSVQALQERLEDRGGLSSKLLLPIFRTVVKGVKSLRSLRRSLETSLAYKAYKEAHQEACHAIPIIINNRNHLTYLKRLIHSLEKKGYHNIFIIDNASAYPPLLAYYKQTPYKVFYLQKNVGYCALWDTPIFEQFRDQYYIYTDSDLELAEECPEDFMVAMHYLLNRRRYSKIGKVGLSLLINDLPAHFNNRAEVIAWEEQFWRQRVEKLAFSAPVDTTFALYRPGSFGPASMVPALRMDYPYSARHLPWYENTGSLSPEQQYYYQHARASSHWSSKALPL